MSSPIRMYRLASVFTFSLVLCTAMGLVPMASAQNMTQRIQVDQLPTIVASPVEPGPERVGNSRILSVEPGQVMVQDTLRNFFKGNTVFRFPASSIAIGSTGWVHGTNSFFDRAKATRLSLPSGITSGTVNEVWVTFIHKANRVTTETYSIDVLDVNGSAPGNLLSSQTFSFASVNADEDLNTPAFTSIHTLNTPTQVGSDFFVSVNLGTYTDADTSNIDIASTDLLGRFVSEDWEQFDDGTWENMSDSWFDNSDDGWYMWIEAVVNYTVDAGGGPAITHAPVTEAVTTEDLRIQADITDPSGVGTVLLAYLEGGRVSTGFTTVVMSPTVGTTYEGTIPMNGLSLRGLQYIIAAEDLNGDLTTNGPYDLRIRSEEGLTQSVQVSGTDENAYRLVSFPFDMDVSTPAGVLEDDLGAYNASAWRFFSLQADQSYREFPNTGAIEPGQAYWLAVSESGRQLTTGPGRTTSLASIFEVQLNPGWNFIGTPFNYSIPAGQLGLNSGGSLDIRSFQGGWSAYTGALQPFQGYAVAANTSDRLLIFPFPIDTATKTAQGAALAKQDTDTAIKWFIDIEAEKAGYADTDNRILVAEAAVEGWDAMDRPEPPVIGDYVSLYFPHPDWEVPFSRFSTDARADGDDLETWEFEVEAATAGHISLTFNGLDQVPSDVGVWLMDHALEEVFDLRERQTYNFFASGGKSGRSFSILTGKGEAFNDLIETVGEVPSQIETSNFPNPFSAGTTISYGLPEAAEVSLEIYDLLGKRVATLMQQSTVPAGRHSIIWDGRNQAGQAVASGMYLLVMQQEGSRHVHRMVLRR